MRLVPALVCAALAAAPLAAADFVWVEGEAPSRGQGYPHNWYSDMVQKGALSGNAFLSSFTDKADTEVDYDIEIPADGEYTLWARVNPIQAAVSWRQDGGAWQVVDLSKAVDSVNIASDAKPDLRFLAWVKVGKLPLKAGKTAIGFKLHSANNHHGALDCFVLTTKPFLPSGKNQPAGAKPAAGFDASSFVWIEGEDARDDNFKPHNWYSGMVKKDSLSGGNWLSTFDGPANASATWEFEIPKAGVWTLWLRANPIQAGIDWRLDDGAWQAADVSRPQDQVNLASDGKPDLRFVAWMQAAKADIAAGKHRLQLRTTSKLNNHAAIDAIVFAAKPFAPNGKAKPGTALGEADPGWFAFEPGVDEFRSDALLDLRNLNEKRAGEKGWLKAAGDDIVGADGKPLRFWAINASSHEGEDAARYLFARLAKTGVNLARIHGLIADRSGNDPMAVSKKALDDLHINIAAAAEQGVYLNVSSYFPLWMQLKDSDGIPGCATGKNPFALLLFEPRFQAMYKAWAKAVLTSQNPYTGKRVCDDPAVAFWELQNEDSFFFWTMKKDAVGPGPWATLQGLFAEWAIARHGSLDKAMAAWGGDRHPEDDVAAKRLGLYGPWETTRDGYSKQGAKQARIRDQIRFYAEQSRKAYADLGAYLRSECGFKGMVVAGNWTTADNRQLGGIERWTYAAATDVVDRHGYFGGKHEGDGSGWSVRAGNTYEDKAAVLDPADTPLGYLQLAGRPHIHSEIAWNKPNRYTADGQLLMASYGALQGVDSFIGFALQKGTWAGDGNGKWPAAMPGAMGQWPAAALQFRRGDVAPAPVAVRQIVTADDMFALKGSGVVEGQNADFRMAEAPKAVDAGNDAGFDPLTYYAGRAERVIAGMAGVPADAKPVALDLAKAIDRQAKVVTSLTGELRWDWGRGVVTVNTPRSQAATGFLGKAGEVKLGDLTIRCGSEYGTVHAISLDGQPLATSKRILVQAFTEEKMYGFRAAGGRIEDTGRTPINVRELDASVTFAKPVAAATALDGHGYGAGAVPVQGGTVTLPKDRLYVIVTR
ncbi:MAG: hypothetical protein J0M02_06280 [Planctomycetes bacterium]|nr:hypothetical protein [Planctomycetota bacterium]